DHHVEVHRFSFSRHGIISLLILTLMGSALGTVPDVRVQHYSDSDHQAKLFASGGGKLSGEAGPSRVFLPIDAWPPRTARGSAII
ncbi:MAG: hypothetical protein AAF404_21200, partial [Pseudomonadota bacterium]